MHEDISQFLGCGLLWRLWWWKLVEVEEEVEVENLTKLLAVDSVVWGRDKSRQAIHSKRAYRWVISPRRFKQCLPPLGFA